MAQRLSRRKMAGFVADKLQSGASARDAMKEVAAHLVETGRTRELELLVRDIEDMLAGHGVVVADVTTAHPLSSGIKAEIAKLVGAKKLQMREQIDPTVLGGVRVEVPGKRFDGTIRRKLLALKTKQL